MNTSCKSVESIELNGQQSEKISKQKKASTVSFKVESFELNGQQLEKEKNQRRSSNVSQISVESFELNGKQLENERRHSVESIELNVHQFEKRRNQRRASHTNPHSAAALLGLPEYSNLEESLWELNNVMQKSFKSAFEPREMRQLALVAHNHMKPAMKVFIETHAEILKKFRITGTNTTMSMCKAIFGEHDPDVEYGVSCCSGPLGGDAQIAAQMVMEDIGGIIFFVDPMSAHPHQCDIDSLIRLANVGNVMLASNPATAESLLHLLRLALEEGKREMFPSFFYTLESPSVPEYKNLQAATLQKAIDS